VALVVIVKMMMMMGDKDDVNAVLPLLDNITNNV
jgi:hypothetical protein